MSRNHTPETIRKISEARKTKIVAGLEDALAHSKGRLALPSYVVAIYAPRGMSREEAARYIGIGVTKFDEMVGDRRMPKPKRIDGRVVWDRLKLEAAFSDLPDDEHVNPLDRMLADSPTTKSFNSLVQQQVKDDPEFAQALSQNAMGVKEFCKRHSISRGLFYELLRNGQGPDIMRVGRRMLISQEAAAEWRAKQTARTIMEQDRSLLSKLAKK